LIPKLDEELKPEVIHWATFYEHRVRTGSKVIFHLEAFVAKGSACAIMSDNSDEDNCRILDGNVLSV
jgi:Replication factor C subunit 3, C-terminal domain